MAGKGEASQSVALALLASSNRFETFFELGPACLMLESNIRASEQERATFCQAEHWTEFPDIEFVVLVVAIFVSDVCVCGANETCAE